MFEFQTRIPEFRPQDFASCYWWVWAPLIWPAIIGNEEESCWKFFLNHDLQEDFLAAWHRLDFTGLFAVMTSAAFDPPPSWSTGLYATQLVSKYLAIKKLAERFKHQLRLLEWKAPNINQLGISTVQQDAWLNNFQRIIGYQPPARERIALILEWQENNCTLTQDIEQKIQHNGLQAEFKAYQRNPKEILPIRLKLDMEGKIYCPKCFGGLDQQCVSQLKRGKLVLCSISKDAWLYKTEEALPKVIS